MREMKKCSLFLIPVLVVCTLVVQTGAAINNDADTKVYVVYMGERKQSEVEEITKSHHAMLGSVLGSNEAAMESMIYSYRHGFSGFAAKMTEGQAKYFEGLPDVVKVFPDRLYKLDTTQSNTFLDEADIHENGEPPAPKPASGGLLPEGAEDQVSDAMRVDDTIIGILDSGIRPESESFSDRGLGPIPNRWRGFCQRGQAFNPAVHCNRKLIGARYFNNGFLAAYGKPYNTTAEGEYLSPRDAIGHGTHVASTAAGALVSSVSLNGLANGTARGSSPRSRLAVYKVAWNGVISSVDVLKAFDTAIQDGVDVVSVSQSFGLPLWPETDKRDLIYYGSFHAIQRGITVVCSAGNKGDLSGTVVNVAPWVITVGASSLDRKFAGPIILGNNQRLTGQSMYVGRDTGFVSLAFFREAADTEGPVSCEGITARDTWVAGKVVLCFSLGSEAAIISASKTAEKAGALGFIATRRNVVSLYNYYSPRFPTVLVTFEVGAQILEYIRFTADPRVRLRPTNTYIGKEASTYIPFFSSRGPNSLSPAVLKPDIVAPGTDIIAASIPNRDSPRGYLFKSGTSMACPHVSGIVARIKAQHPNWSPAAIKSAIVTTGWTIDPYNGEPIISQGQSTKVADAFDYGGGLVFPAGAMNPGLVYDMGAQDYVTYLCAMAYPKRAINQLTGRSCLRSGNSILDVNLPSITIPTLRDSVTVTRTVTNVGVNSTARYKAVIDSPPGTLVKVKPRILQFNDRVKKRSFKVTITTFHNITTEYYFGWLIWSDGIYYVKTPISVRTVSQVSLW